MQWEILYRTFNFLIMKKIILILSCIVLLIEVAKGQEEEKSPIVQYLIKRGYSFSVDRKKNAADSTSQWPDTIYYNTTYTATLLGSPTIPISFSRIEYVDGKYQVSPSISIGYGYTWFFGDFIFNENDKITVDPRFLFGLIADIGLQNDFSFKKLTGLFVGGFIGFGNFSLFGGFDLLGNTPTIGLGGRIDLYTVHQISMKPFGKVREVRRHKMIAPAVADE